MTILSSFTLNIPIRRLWTNLYHKEDHFLKIYPLLHYFLDIYLKICDFALFLKNFFCPLKKKHVHIFLMTYYSPISNSFNLGRVFFSLKFYDIYSFLGILMKKVCRKFHFFLNQLILKKCGKTWFPHISKNQVFQFFFNIEQNKIIK